MMKALSPMAVALAGLMVVTATYTQPAFSEHHEGAHKTKMGQCQDKACGKHHGKHSGEGFKQKLQQLNLTPEQQAKIDALMQSGKEQKQANREQLKAKFKELMAVLKSDSGTKEQALALHREISQMKSAMGEQRINKMFEMKAILTPEQQAKFKTLMQEGRKHHKKGDGQSWQKNDATENPASFAPEDMNEEM